MSEITNTLLPRHIGFIVDGNRRWAREHNLSTLEGHRRGFNLLRKVAHKVFDHGVEYVSAYVFSTENWNRTEKEVDYLMGLIARLAEKDIKSFVKRGIRVRFLGVTDRVNEKLLSTIRKCEAQSAHGTKGTLAVCFNYGGRREIADACREIIAKGIPAGEITEQTIAEHLYDPEIPNIDLMVRTSGEQRLSNFMLWRCAYSEFLFLDKKWPELTEKDVPEMLTAYASRQRRFGGN